MLNNKINYGLNVRMRVLFVLSILLLSPCSICGEEVFRDTESERMEMLKDLKANWPERLNEYLDTAPPLTIHGRVVDQNNDPVPGAEIDIHWEYFDKLEFYQTHIGTETIKTDSMGFFIFTKNNALDLTMYDVSRIGYEFKQELTPYYQAGSGRKALRENSVQEPIIVYMRKLNPTTFLLKSSVSHSFKEPNTILRYTMIPGLMFKDDADLSKMKKPEQNDLVFTVNNNEDGSYTMHIQPIPGIGGAMQILDEYLYESPANGYEPAASLSIRPEDGKLTKYLYFTSRKTPVYSRMTMELRIDDYDNELRFHGTTWTNPYGKRNLEWEPELPSRLETKLFLEAEEALNNGILPSEPADLQALIEQYK